MSRLSRRDFLKLIAAASASACFSPAVSALETGSQPNVLILLFDTLSARHMSLHGYFRETTPNITRFAEKATVYHSSYAGGNFTSSGTASLLTGLYPWTHRAVTYGGLIRRDLSELNMFRLMGPDFHRIAFGQNMWVEIFLDQFANSIDRHLPPTSFSITGSRYFIDDFLKEKGLGWYIFDDMATGLSPDMPGSLVGGYLSTLYMLRHGPYYRYGFPEYPKGIPVMQNYNVAFTLEDVFSGVQADIIKAARGGKPFLGYYHFFSPHEPSKPREDFIRLFNRDGFAPVEKPFHSLSLGQSETDLREKRLMYDRYLANVDHDFGLLIDRLESEGILENTYIVLTSDHGQLFERGDYGHGTPLMYESVIHVPLLIRAPGQRSRQDIYEPVSSIDLLPTLLSLFGKEMPANLEGKLLPGFGGAEDARRPIYSVVAYRNSAFLPLTTATIAMRKAAYKLIHTFGYKDYPDTFELYNLEADPDELENLFDAETVVAKHMKQELLDSLETANRPFRRN
jgi:arylsulfatase A-like enzyme